MKNENFEPYWMRPPAEAKKPKIRKKDKPQVCSEWLALLPNFASLLPPPNTVSAGAASKNGGSKNGPGSQVRAKARKRRKTEKTKKEKVFAVVGLATKL
jgi:hypothetical protein